MCDACVIESVKQRMLSRRNLFKTAGAAAAATVGTNMAAPALAANHSKLADLTHELHEQFPTFFGEQQFFKEQKFTGMSTSSTCSNCA